MKNKRWVIACVVAAIMVLFVGCPNPSGNGKSSINTTTQSLTDRINGASGTINFNNARISENAEVNSAVTIKNLKMGGKTLTINAAGVELNGVSEAKIIIGRDVDEGEVTIKNCDNITKLEVNGGGENSIKVYRSKVDSVQIKKERVRVVLTNTNVSQKVTVEAKQTKLEVTDDSTLAGSKISTLEIAPNVDNVTIKDAEITTISVQSDSSASTTVPAVTMSGEIKVSEIEGKKLNVVLNKDAEIMSTVSVKTENLTLELKDTTSKIKNLDISKDVENVNISGGQIEKITVKSGNSTGTGSGTEAKTPSINITGKVDITEVTGTTTLYKTSDVTDFTPPSGITATTIEIDRITLDSTTAKKEYKTLEDFDWTGLCANVIYSNNSKKRIQLTADNCTITGFDSSKAGNTTVKVKYNNEEIGSIIVTITRVVTDITLDKNTAKTECYIGDSFDYTGLYAVVTYNNSTTPEKIQLTEGNCTITGFNSSKAGIITVRITYDGKEIGSLSITVKEDPRTEQQKKAESEGYIEEAIQKLTNPSSYVNRMPDVDGAVALFKKSYETYKTDQTRLYYALAELASISTDESVAKLLKENYGFKNYPTTMNALLSGSWMKEYISSTTTPIYTVSKKLSGNYIRVTGELIKANWNSAPSNSALVSYVLDEDGDWIDEWAYEYQTDGYDSSNSYYVKNPVPSETGKYLISSSSYVNNYEYLRVNGTLKEFNNDNNINYDIRQKNKPNGLRVQQLLDNNGNWIYESSYARELHSNSNNYWYYQYYVENPVPSETGVYRIYKSYYDNRNCLYDVTDSSRSERVPYGNRSTLAPEFLVPSDINQDTYNSTLCKSMQTSETMSYLLLMNILSCNAEGFNTQIDNILNVFGTKYNNAKKVASEISQETIELPAVLIQALKLNETFGSSTIKIGKAEVDVLFAATDIVKGVIQWLSSYDLSVDLKATLWNVYGGNIGPGEGIAALSNAKTFGVRSTEAMTESKATILNALNSALASYKYVTETSKTYPSEIKNLIKQYCDPIYTYVEDGAKALKDGTTFTVEEGNISLSVDMGKLFTPGYLEKVYVKDSEGNIKTTVIGYVYCELEDGIVIGDGEHYWGGSNKQKNLSTTFNLDYTKDVYKQIDDAIKANLPWSDISAGRIYVREANAGWAINKKAVTDLITLTTTQNGVVADLILTGINYLQKEVPIYVYKTYSK